jgi:hypothetical protein
MSSPVPECVKRIGFDHIKRRNLACTVLMGVVVVCGVECCWPLHATFFFYVWAFWKEHKRTDERSTFGGFPLHRICMYVS